MLKIGFYRDALIGDNLVALNAIYAIKSLYPDCTLVVYTNSIGMELYEQFSFIDELFNMQTCSKAEIQKHINSHCFDYIILTQANRWRCTLLNQTNCKKVISLLSLGSIFKLKFHTIFISRNLSSTPQYQRLLKLVREINPKHFDTYFPKIDFSPIKLKTKQDNQEFIDSFLAPYQDFSSLVMLNPFSRTCSHNLKLQSWIYLAEKLAKLYPQTLFIIPTYEGNPIKFDFSSKLPNIAIFYNNSDLFNLIELISRLKLLISPSTGNAHIANNLNIPLLGLFSKRDTMLWRGENMKHFVIIPKHKEKLSAQEEQNLISKTLQKAKQLL